MWIRTEKKWKTSVTANRKKADQVKETKKKDEINTISENYRKGNISSEYEQKKTLCEMKGKLRQKSFFRDWMQHRKTIYSSIFTFVPECLHESDELCFVCMDGRVFELNLVTVAYFVFWRSCGGDSRLSATSH